MAKLPSNTFMFNYNARFYDPATYTFAKTKGQLFDEDLVLNKAPTSYGEDNVNFGNSGAYMSKTYSSNAENPFNRSSSLGNSFTFICKTSGFTGNMTNIFANRYNNYNYMVRGNIFHTSSSTYLTVNPPTHPVICVLRVNENGSSIRKFVDENGNVISGASVSASSISWGSINNGVGFFAGFANGGEYFNATFYWMYCSLEPLTDEEILKVIQYNENPVSFSIDPDNITFGYDSGSTTVNISAEAGWTASTSNSWITLSETEGLGDTAITVSVSDNYNNSANRIGTVSFTDGEEVLTLSIAQKADTRIILKNIYRSGESVKQMFRNGVIIYKQCYKLTFNVDTDSITFDNTGGTYTINITANEKWTMTIPNWLTASSLSGIGNASIIISTNSVPESKLEGNIIISCANKTHTIDVEQKSAGPDLTQPLTFEILSDGALYLQRDSSLYTCYYKYKLNDGEWIIKDNNYNQKICDVVAGDIVQVKYYQTNNYEKFYFSSTCQFKVSGNIMSLITNDYESATTLSTQNVFYGLFNGCTGLTDASNLLLPATNLSGATYCYGILFQNCSSLTVAPSLPATTLGQRCYYQMFNGCTSLTSAPELPATTLEINCYQSMFYGCTSLRTAPALPATTLANNCYSYMFRNCSNLNYIKCLATNISASRCTTYWVQGVAATGTFIKNPNMSSWTTGNGGIPSNWTVEDDS